MKLDIKTSEEIIKDDYEINFINDDGQIKVSKYRKEYLKKKWVLVKSIKKELAELINLIPMTLTLNDQRVLDKIYKIKDGLK